MNITLKRGPNLEAHLTVVQYIKGVGPQRAKALIRGETITIELETPSRDVVIRNLRKLAADGALVVEGLLGMTESNSSAETTTVGAVNPANDLAEALARVLSSAVNEDKVRSVLHSIVKNLGWELLDSFECGLPRNKMREYLATSLDGWIVMRYHSDSEDERSNADSANLWATLDLVTQATCWSPTGATGIRISTRDRAARTRTSSAEDRSIEAARARSAMALLSPAYQSTGRAY